jgi:hypothetical protein
MRHLPISSHEAPRHQVLMKPLWDLVTPSLCFMALRIPTKDGLVCVARMAILATQGAKDPTIHPLCPI